MTGESDFPGVKLLKLERHHDQRGFFQELMKDSLRTTNEFPHFLQDNFSFSNAGVIRGLHWQKSPHGQGKLVSCLSGQILDIVVDINPKRKTFGRHLEFQLSENTAELLWIPSDYAHGFQALEDKTIVMYKVTNEWNKDSEMSVSPLDPNLGIKWKNIPILISDKDKNAQTFDNYKLNL